LFQRTGQIEPTVHCFDAYLDEMNRLLLPGLILLSTVTWGQDYTFKLYEYSGGNYRAYSIQQTIDGNFLIIANRDCYTPGSITIEGCPHSPDLIKIDEQGNIIWKSSFEDLSWLSLPVHENADGSFSIASFTHENFKCGDVFIGLFGLARSIGFRLGDDASLLSTKVYNDECDMPVVSSVHLPGDRIVFLQKFRDLNWIQLDTIITMTDKDFNTVWSTYLPGSEMIGYEELIYTTQDDLYLLMHNRETDSLALGRLDDFGNIVETFIIKATLPIDYIKNVIPTKNNQLIIVGRVPSAGMDPSKTVALRTDLIGQIVWQKTIPTRYSMAILETQNELTLLAHEFYNDVTNSKDIVLTAYDVNGDSLTSRTYDINAGDDVPVSMVETDGGNIMLLGETNCCNYEASIGPGEIFVIRDTTFQSVSDINNNSFDHRLVIMPNPAEDEIRIISHDEINGSLTVYDMLSRRLYSGDITTYSPIDISFLPKGAYVVLLKDGETSHTGKIVKN
jgi:hypothetical protein